LGALGPKGKAAATIVNVISGGDDDTELFGINGKSSSSSGNSVFTSSTQQAEAVEKLSSVQKLHSEVTIGGDPNVDWRAWAATVRQCYLYLANDPVSNHPLSSLYKCLLIVSHTDPRKANASHLRNHWTMGSNELSTDSGLL
jgi:hypothetical protein